MDLLILTSIQNALNAVGQANDALAAARANDGQAAAALSQALAAKAVSEKAVEDARAKLADVGGKLLKTIDGAFPGLLPLVEPAKEEAPPTVAARDASPEAALATAAEPESAAVDAVMASTGQG